MEFEYSFVIPCLNEENTLKLVIDEIKESIVKNKLNAEILVVDNNSTDNSKNIAISNGARVITENIKGYGSALISGNKNATGKYCIMGDADCSYDFLNIGPFLKAVEDGNDLVIGNRFGGKLEKFAMPFFHKIGGKALTGLANILFGINLQDYNCGIRVYNREKINNLKLQQLGMEYASEMIIKAKKNGLSIAEVPTNYRKDKRLKKSNLRTVRDGFRHLFLILKLRIKE